MNRGWILLLGVIVTWACAAPPRPRLDPPPLPQGELPAEADPAFARGWQEVVAGRASEAIKAFTLSAAPETLRITGFGYVSWIQGNQGNARSAFEKALGLAPRNWLAAWALSWIHDRDGNAEAAVTVLEQAAPGTPPGGAISLRIQELCERESRRWRQQAETNRTAGQLVAASEAAGRALRYNPGDPDLLRLAAGLFLETGSVAKALPHLETLARRPDASGDDLRRLAEACERAGDLEGALLAFTRAQALNPGDSAMTERLARIQLKFLARDAHPRFRAIFGKTALTREDLVALIDRQFGSRLVLRGEAPRILSDVPGSFVGEAIVCQATLGVIKPAGEHTFDRFSLADRTLLALALKELADRLIPPPTPPAASTWPRPIDVPEGHRGAMAIAFVLGQRLLALDDQGRFFPENPVTPLEALTVLSGLSRIIPPPR